MKPKKNKFIANFMVWGIQDIQAQICVGAVLYSYQPLHLPHATISPSAGSYGFRQIQYKEELPLIPDFGVVAGTDFCCSCDPSSSSTRAEISSS